MFWGPSGLFWELGSGSRIIVGSTHIVQQLFFSMFDIDLILGSFFTFCGHNWPFLWGSKTVLKSTQAVEQLSLSMLPSILTFEFDLILGLFLTFWPLMGCFLGRSRVWKLVWGLLLELNNFYFLCFLQFWLLILT